MKSPTTKPTRRHPAGRLLHISASPRGRESISLRIAQAYVDAHRATRPQDEVDHWNLWDGTLPAFGPAGASAKMTVFGGGEPGGEAAAAWRSARAAFERFDAADRLLFSVPMWNANVPYILKQFIDVISQPGWIFGVDPKTGYQPLLAGSGKSAVVVYTSAVWGPRLGREFGRDFQSTFFRDWLEWTGITDITEIRYHPTLTGDRDTALAAALDAAARAGREASELAA
ncbi:MAG TPA: NAD(P)H-dependent oxidoreductase [Gaiellales bacterium]|nr:NAD(P)H-dependent oxidoreductase [Gaiellales bacterium]